MRMKFKKVRINSNSEIDKYKGMTGVIKKENHKADIDNIIYLVIFPNHDWEWFYLEEMELLN